MWPSGAERITSVAPMIVDAPGLFSTITETPSDCVSFAASARAWMSVWPPAGKGTTIRTGLPG